MPIMAGAAPVEVTEHAHQQVRLDHPRVPAGLPSRGRRTSRLQAARLRGVEHVWPWADWCARAALSQTLCESVSELIIVFVL